MKDSKTGIAVWIVGVIFGLIAAVVHLLVPEQGLTFLWVMLSTMILGFWKSRAPWRWLLLVVLFIPAADLSYKIWRPQQVSRAALWGAGLMVLAAIPGAFGGAFMRGVIGNIFNKQAQ